MTRIAGLVRGLERAEADRRVLDRTVQAAEQERIYIATELHDGPIQRLAVLSYDLERAKQRMLGNPTAVARVEHAQATLSTEVQGLPELMASLRPPTLDEVGLEAALRDHVGAFARRSGGPPRSGWTWTAGSTASWRRSSTGSPRRRCSTWPAMPRRAGSGWRWRGPATGSIWRSATTASASSR